MQHPLDAWFAVPTATSPQVVFAPPLVSAATPVMVRPQQEQAVEALRVIAGCNATVGGGGGPAGRGTLQWACVRRGLTRMQLLGRLPAARSITTASPKDHVVLFDALPEPWHFPSQCASPQQLPAVRLFCDNWMALGRKRDKIIS